MGGMCTSASQIVVLVAAQIIMAVGHVIITNHQLVGMIQETSIGHHMCIQDIIYAHLRNFVALPLVCLHIYQSTTLIKHTLVDVWLTCVR